METSLLHAASGTLTDDERMCLDTFSKLCYQEKLLQRPEGLQHGDLIDGLTDEHTLLRFLRGKSFDVDRAYEQLKEALAIRQSAGVIATYDTIDLSDFEEKRKLYPHWSGRRDKSGKPICIFDSRHLDDVVIQRYNEDRSVSRGDAAVSSAMEQAIVFHDYLTRFVFPVCSAMCDRKQPGTAISSAVYIADVSGMTLKQAWNLRMYIQDFGVLLSTCFPEVIDRIYAVNAPSYFGAIWSFVRKLIDPRTASKVEILYPGQVPAALAAIADADDLPTQYGGRREVEYGAPPVMDEAMLQSLTSSSLGLAGQWPQGPIKLRSNGDGQVALIAVGAEGGDRRRDLIGLIR
ncbi:CRAL/TRIO domain protein [Metarhizium robertsii]|uniref:Cellular retinaldehyde-binding/triple function n=2 Tax=Metarhizium robertsii TaxID=568076 RepID=E9FCB8_METRA|nr:Cellular retinaldehyde-binding/triple function [Metarhizium robertsii ARSEF 23]EFY94616.1 Cellular retinaldehyde-binding/triple function [Metarhizium robertsii ARSEF 23]EXU95945.1 CRAL/TRIO domain protein [Metarhizium robertsii]